MKSQQIKLGVVVGALGLAMLLLVYQLTSQGADISEMASGSSVMDSETGEVIPRFMAPKEFAPWVNPKTGKRTLWPAEPCYYNKDGSVKSKPTMVIPNDVGYTDAKVCPDCGRKVVSRNPRPKIEEIEAAKAAGR